MSKIKSIALLSACFAVLATGFASNPTARDVGPPVTGSAKYEKNASVYVSPAMVVTNDYLLVNPAEMVIVSTDPGKYVSACKNEDPAPAAIPGTTVKSRSNLAFMDRHRRSGNDVGKYTNTEADLTTKHNALKFTDRHRRIRA